MARTLLQLSSAAAPRNLMQQVLLEAPPALLRRAVIHVLCREHVAGIVLRFCKPAELSTPVRAVQAMALG